MNRAPTPFPALGGGDVHEGAVEGWRAPEVVLAHPVHVGPEGLLQGGEVLKIEGPQADEFRDVTLV